MGTNNEKRYLTRATAMILAVIMVVSMLPASMLTIFADGGEEETPDAIVSLTIDGVSLSSVVGVCSP